MSRCRSAPGPPARIFGPAYDSVLGRKAAYVELDWWADALRNGFPYATMAEQFTAHSSAKSNREFVEQLYFSSFGRAGDEQGIRWWTEQLDAGRAWRGPVAYGFAGDAYHIQIITAQDYLP